MKFIAALLIAALLLAFTYHRVDGEEWITVKKWQGSGNMTTEKFEIKDSSWRITWKATAGQFPEHFAIQVYDNDGEYVELVANLVVYDHKEGQSYVHQSGIFYLEINGTENWEVTVEESSDKSSSLTGADITVVVVDRINSTISLKVENNGVVPIYGVAFVGEGVSALSTVAPIGWTGQVSPTSDETSTIAGFMTLNAPIGHAGSKVFTVTFEADTTISIVWGVSDENFKQTLAQGQILSLPIIKSITVITDKDFYIVEGVVKVSGRVDMYSNSPITIYAINPFGEIYKSVRTPVNSDKTFTTVILLGPPITKELVVGTWKIRADYLSQSAETTFRVEAKESPSIKQQDETERVISAKITAKQIRDLVIIRARNSEDSSAEVYSVKFSVQDGKITAARGPNNWEKRFVSDKEVNLNSGDLGQALVAGAKEYFRLKVTTNVPEIKWTVFDEYLIMMDEGVVKPIISKPILETVEQPDISEDQRKPPVQAKEETKPKLTCPTDGQGSRVDSLTQFWLYKEGDVYRARFSMMDKDMNMIGESGKVEVRILDDKENVLYFNEFCVKEDDFKEYQLVLTGAKIYAYAWTFRSSDVKPPTKDEFSLGLGTAILLFTTNDGRTLMIDYKLVQLPD